MRVVDKTFTVKQIKIMKDALRHYQKKFNVVANIYDKMHQDIYNGKEYSEKKAAILEIIAELEKK